MKGSEENLHWALRLAKSRDLRTDDVALIGVEQNYRKFENGVDVSSTPEDSARLMIA
jgi:hypothetical protein